MNNYKTPHIWFSIIIICLLLLPFISKVFSNEIYPSVIMPSGNGLLKIDNNTTSVNEVKFFAMKNGESFELEKKTLFKNIHRKNYNYISKSLSKVKSKNAPETSELIKWLSNNVGFEFDSLMINNYQNVYQLAPLKIVKAKKVKSKIIK